MNGGVLFSTLLLMSSTKGVEIGCRYAGWPPCLVCYTKATSKERLQSYKRDFFQKAPIFNCWEPMSSRNGEATGNANPYNYIQMSSSFSNIVAKGNGQIAKEVRRFKILHTLQLRKESLNYLGRTELPAKT